VNPNHVTALRIVVAPLFAYAFIRGNHGSALFLWLAVAVLAIIELSDALDGHIARSQGKVSDFGKFFDPVADSISRLTVFASFLVAGVIPLWMFLIFLYRDTFVSGLRYLCVQRGVVVPARTSGKLKAIFQAIAGFGVVLAALAHVHGLWPVPPTLLGQSIGYWIMLVPALYTAYSALDYWNGTRRVIGTKPPSTTQPK